MKSMKLQEPNYIVGRASMSNIESPFVGCLVDAMHVWLKMILKPLYMSVIYIV